MVATSVRARSLLLLLAELAALAAVFYADHRGVIPLSKTPFLALIAWASLRLRHLRWRDVGLEWPGSDALRFFGIGVLAGTAFWAFEYFVENPVLHAINGRYPDLTDFQAVVGSLEMLALILALNLVLAAFGEEIVWRGYALPRVAGLIGDGRAAWGVALIVVNVFFGIAHAYQGESGVVQASVQGVLLGLLYLGTGRTLLAPMVAHFVANTCDFVLIYAGVHLGLRP